MYVVLTVEKESTMKFKEFALEIVKYEGKMKEVNTTQIHDILRITLRILADEMRKDPFGVMKFLARY